MGDLLGGWQDNSKNKQVSMSLRVLQGGIRSAKDAQGKAPVKCRVVGRQAIIKDLQRVSQIQSRWTGKRREGLGRKSLSLQSQF